MNNEPFKVYSPGYLTNTFLQGTPLQQFQYNLDPTQYSGGLLPEAVVSVDKPLSPGMYRDENNNRRISRENVINNKYSFIRDVNGKLILVDPDYNIIMRDVQDDGGLEDWISSNNLWNKPTDVVSSGKLMNIQNPEGMSQVRKDFEWGGDVAGYTIAAPFVARALPTVAKGLYTNIAKPGLTYFANKILPNTMPGTLYETLTGKGATTLAEQAYPWLMANTKAGALTNAGFMALTGAEAGNQFLDNPNIATGAALATSLPFMPIKTNPRKLNAKWMLFADRVNPVYDKTIKGVFEKTVFPVYKLINKDIEMDPNYKFQLLPRSFNGTLFNKGRNIERESFSPWGELDYADSYLDLNKISFNPETKKYHFLTRATKDWDDNYGLDGMSYKFASKLGYKQEKLKKYYDNGRFIEVEIPENIMKAFYTSSFYPGSNYRLPELPPYLFKVIDENGNFHIVDNPQLRTNFETELPIVQSPIIKGEFNNLSIMQARRAIDLQLDNNGIVFGSMIPFSRGYIPGINKDTEIITTESLLPKVKTLLDFNETGRNSVGGLKGFSEKWGRGLTNEMDLDIIFNGSKKGTSKGALAHLIYQVLYPDEAADLYRNASKNLFKGIDDIYDLDVPLSPEKLLSKLKEDDNIELLQLIDELGIGTNTNLESANKHRRRAYNFLVSDNPYLQQLITKAIPIMGRRYMGKEFVQPSALYKNIDYNDVSQNREFLEYINKDLYNNAFTTEQLERISKNPQLMKNIFDYWYYNQFFGNRMISPTASMDLKIAHSALFTNGQFKDGNHSGPGANYLKGGMKAFHSSSYPIRGIRYGLLSYYPEKFKGLGQLVPQIQKTYKYLPRDNELSAYYNNTMLPYEDEVARIFTLSKENDFPIFANTIMERGNAAYGGNYIGPLDDLRDPVTLLVIPGFGAVLKNRGGEFGGVFTKNFFQYLSEPKRFKIYPNKDSFIKEVIPTKRAVFNTTNNPDEVLIDWWKSPIFKETAEGPIKQYVSLYDHQRQLYNKRERLIGDLRSNMRNFSNFKDHLKNLKNVTGVIGGISTLPFGLYMYLNEDERKRKEKYKEFEKLQPLYTPKGLKFDSPLNKIWFEENVDSANKKLKQLRAPYKMVKPYRRFEAPVFELDTNAIRLRQFDND